MDQNITGVYFKRALKPEALNKESTPHLIDCVHEIEQIYRYESGMKFQEHNLKAAGT